LGNWVIGLGNWVRQSDQFNYPITQLPDYPIQRSHVG
jgi:hypothetical protein